MSTETLQSMLEAKYDNATSEYRKTANCDIAYKEIDQAKIRLLEELLYEMFGIECEFDFENIY